MFGPGGAAPCFAKGTAQIGLNSSEFASRVRSIAHLGAHHDKHYPEYPEWEPVALCEL